MSHWENVELHEVNVIWGCCHYIVYVLLFFQQCILLKIIKTIIFLFVGAVKTEIVGFYDSDLKYTNFQFFKIFISCLLSWTWSHWNIFHHLSLGQSECQTFLSPLFFNNVATEIYFIISFQVHLILQIKILHHPFSQAM